MFGTDYDNGVEGESLALQSSWKKNVTLFKQSITCVGEKDNY